MLFVLVIVGRRVEVTDAAAAAASTSVASANVAATNLVDASIVSADAVTDSVAPQAIVPETMGEAARPIETLADGAVIVDLNLASEDELRKLPGIGPGRARRILELRARLGRLKSVDDLARIKGFGRTLLKRLRPLVRIS